MAMDATLLSKSIVDAVTKGKPISDEDKAQMTKSWFTICDELIKHIQLNATVTAITPVVETDPARTGSRQVVEGEAPIEEEPISVQIYTIA